MPTIPLEYRETVETSATPEQVWAALVEPEQVARYHMTNLLKLDPVVGGEILYGAGEDIMISGRVTRIEPGQVLEHTFSFGDPVSSHNADADPETLVAYLLEPSAEGTALTIHHTGFEEENQTYGNISEGWPYILEALKAHLGNMSSGG
jgi:uncharacterized protein YndB with AHSA1/START domain